mgnify:CR=1 FL=1
MKNCIIVFFIILCSFFVLWQCRYSESSDDGGQVVNSLDAWDGLSDWQGNLWTIQDH